MKIFSIPAYIFYIILYPLTSLVTIISNFILKTFFKVSPEESEFSFSKVELENYIENEIDKSDNNLDSEIEIFQNALELSEIKARDVMVPRAEIIALENSSNILNAKKIFIETGFSKIPIYKNSIDDIVGYIHSFDFLKKPKNINIYGMDFYYSDYYYSDLLHEMDVKEKNRLFSERENYLKTFLSIVKEYNEVTFTIITKAQINFNLNNLKFIKI